MKYEAILKVKREQAEQLERLCKEPDADSARDESLFDEEVKFNNGATMAIQVIASTEPDKESAWTQGILFDKDGFELGCTDVGESFLGEYKIHDSLSPLLVSLEGVEDCYRVNVIIED